MNSISNIWEHPRTSIAGLLIAVVTIAGVLSQQGITLGKAGTGSMVALIGALATALLGLLAQDPASTSRQSVAENRLGGTARLGVWALIALLIPLPFTTGCSAEKVAQEIVNWTPALESAVATVDSTAALLAPADGPVFSSATAGFDAASNFLVAQAKAYLANPSAGVLAQLQTQIVTFEQQVNAALLDAAKIVDPASRKHALAAIQAVAVAATAILSLIESISSKAAVAHMAAQAQIKLSAVRPLLNDSNSAQVVAAHYEEPAWMARFAIERTGVDMAQAGF